MDHQKTGFFIAALRREKVGRRRSWPNGSA